jgi:SAM-dependent methyltransferase
MKFEDYYQHEKISGGYDSVRFQSKGGRIIDNRERGVVRELLGVGTKRKIIDFGCGTGRVLKMLWDSGYRNIVGADVSDSMLAETKRKVPQVKTLRASIVNPPGKLRGFDVCVSLRVIHHLDEQELGMAFQSIRALLKGGGVFIFNTNNSLSFNVIIRGVNPFRRFSKNYFYSESTIKNVLERNGFVVTKKRKVFFVPPFMLRLSNGLAPALNFFSLRIECLAGGRLCASTFWKATKTGMKRRT